MSEFEGRINFPREEEKKFQRLPEQKPSTDNEWAGQSNKKLKQIGSPYKVINTKRYLITMILLIIIAMAGMTYFIMDNKFSPTLNSVCMLNTTCEAPIIPSCPSCNLTCGNYNITFSPMINLNSS